MLIIIHTPVNTDYFLAINECTNTYTLKVKVYYIILHVITVFGLKFLQAK